MSSSNTYNNKIIQTLNRLCTAGFIPSLDLESDSQLADWATFTNQSLDNIENSAKAAATEPNPEKMLTDFVSLLSSHLEIRGYCDYDSLLVHDDEDENEKEEPIVEDKKTSSSVEKSDENISNNNNTVNTDEEATLSQPSSSRPASAASNHQNKTAATTTASPQTATSKRKSSPNQHNQHTTARNDNNPFSAPVNNALPIRGGAQLLRHGNDVARVSRMAQRLAEEVASLQQAKIRMTSQHAQELNQQAGSYREIISELLEQQARLEREMHLHQRHTGGSDVTTAAEKSPGLNRHEKPASISNLMNLPKSSSRY